MEKIIDILLSEMALELLAYLVAAVWAAFRTSAWLGARADARLDKALACLEAGVAQTYEVYVREIKAGREDGKLTAAERQHARERAQQAAIGFARSEGLDLARELGPGLIQAIIERLVRQAKGAK